MTKIYPRELAYSGWAAGIQGIGFDRWWSEVGSAKADGLQVEGLPAAKASPAGLEVCLVAADRMKLTYEQNGLEMPTDLATGAPQAMRMFPHVGDSIHWNDSIQLRVIAIVHDATGSTPSRVLVDDVRNVVSHFEEGEEDVFETATYYPGDYDVLLDLDDKSSSVARLLEDGKGLERVARYSTSFGETWTIICEPPFESHQWSADCDLPFEVLRRRIPSSDSDSTKWRA